MIGYERLTKKGTITLRYKNIVNSIGSFHGDTGNAVTTFKGFEERGFWGWMGSADTSSFGPESDISQTWVSVSCSCSKSNLVPAPSVLCSSMREKCSMPLMESFSWRVKMTSLWRKHWHKEIKIQPDPLWSLPWLESCNMFRLHILSCIPLLDSGI